MPKPKNQPFLEFPDEEPGPLRGNAAAVKLIAENGEANVPIANQLRTFVQRQTVGVRRQQGSGRTATNLFAEADILVAMVLRSLLHIGIADAATLKAAAYGCYRWDEDAVPEEGTHPVTAAIAGFPKGERWTFRMTVAVEIESGTRHIHATVTASEDEIEIAEGFAPVAFVTVPIHRFIERILKARAH